MIYNFLSYIFYFLAVIAGYYASYGLLIQVFPEYGFFHILIGSVVTLMFFPIIPLYPAFTFGNWTPAVICYVSILIGVILSKQSKKSP